MAEGGRKQRIIADSGKMWLSTLIGQFIAFFRGIIIPNLLHPQQYGVLGGLNLITRYSGYLDLGFLSALEREVPRLCGAGDEEALRRTKSVAHFVNIVTIFIYAVILAVIALIMRPHLNEQTFWGVMAFIVLVVLVRLSDFYRYLFRGQGRFGAVSVVVLINSLASFVLVVPLVYYFKLYGFYVGVIADALLIWFIFQFIRKERLQFSLEVKEFKRLLKIGMPLFLMGIGGTILMTMDRFFVIYFFTTEELGYYTLAVTISMFVFLLPVNINKVLAQSLFLDYGKTQTAEILQEYITKTTLVISVSLSALIALTACVYPAVFYVALTHYLPAMEATFLLLISIYFLGIIVACANSLIAQDKQFNIFILQLISILITGLLCFVATETIWGISAVAGAVAIGMAGYALFVSTYTFRSIALPIRAVWVYLLEVTLPLAYCLSALYLTVRLFPLPEEMGVEAFFAHLVTVLYRLGFMLVLLIPMFLIMERRTGIVKDLRVLARRRRRSGD